MRFRLFFDIDDQGHRRLFALEFFYDEEIDWYEVRVFLGEEIVGYLHGYANRGWTPQVNNVWVVEKFRRKGIASMMMSKVEDYFGQIPLPATRIEDNEAARGFWKNYMKGTWTQKLKRK